MIFHLGFSVCVWLFYYTDMYSITFKLQSHKIRHAELIFCSFYLNGSSVLQWCIYSSILYMVNPCLLTLLTYSPSVEVLSMDMLISYPLPYAFTYLTILI